MLTLVLDAGALIALDRNDRDVWAMLRLAADGNGLLEAPAGAIAQAWRGGSRQASLARALAVCTPVSLDVAMARASGELCARSATADVVDASVVIAAARLATTGDVAILTSDTKDMAHLVATLQTSVTVVSV